LVEKKQMEVSIELYKVEEKGGRYVAIIDLHAATIRQKPLPVLSLQDISNAFQASGSIRDLGLPDIELDQILGNRE
jgi:hypothetical protein